MRIVASAQFKEWLSSKRDYPYSHLTMTRSSFYCKWVMLRANYMRMEGVRDVGTECNIVLANSFSVSTLEQLIMTKEARPLPLEMSRIMDDMYVWGRNRSYNWYSGVMDLMHAWLYRAMDVPNKLMVRSCLALEIKSLIYTNFAVYSNVAITLYNNWHTWFDNDYKSAPEDFHALAISSIDYISTAIEIAIIHSVQPATVNSA